MPTYQTWQVTPAAIDDTLLDYEDHLAAVMRRPSRTRGGARRHVKSAEVTGQCSVCLDLFGVSVSLVDGRIVAQEMTPRLKVRRISRGGSSSNERSDSPSFSLYHTHPFSQHHLPDGQVQLYGSKDILLEKLSSSYEGDHPR